MRIYSFNISCRKILINFIIIFSLVYTPFFANASTANPTIGGWKVNQTTDFRIGKKITATKTAMINGVEVVKTSTAAVIPKANNIAKFLAKNAAAAVAIGALDYLLDGVGYVMDPSNTSIIYTPKSTDIVPTGKSFIVSAVFYTSISSACHAAAAASGSSWNSSSDRAVRYYYGGFGANSYNFPGWTDLRSITCLLTSTGNVTVSYVNNPAHIYDDKKTVPLSDVASQVLDKAVEDERRGVISPAVVAARTAAGEMIGEADDDTIAPPIVGSPSTPSEIAKELDKAAAIPSNPAADGTITTPAVVDPVTGEVKAPSQTSNIALDFPVFCGWAPIVCEVAQSVSETIVQAKEYLQDKPKEKEDTEVNVEEIPLPTKQVNVNIGNNTCPSYSVTFLGRPRDISPTYLCEVAQGMHSFFVAMGFFTASVIVGRRK